MAVAAVEAVIAVETNQRLLPVGVTQVLSPTHFPPREMAVAAAEIMAARSDPKMLAAAAVVAGDPKMVVVAGAAERKKLKRRQWRDGVWTSAMSSVSFWTSTKRETMCNSRSRSRSSRR